MFQPSPPSTLNTQPCYTCDLIKQLNEEKLVYMKKLAEIEEKLCKIPLTCPCSKSDTSSHYNSISSSSSKFCHFLH
jgi:hypothetical protein